MKMALQWGGPPKGHNGVISLTSSLSTNNYWRCKLGIGKPASTTKGSTAEYVLKELPLEERDWWSVEGVTGVLEQVNEVLR